MMNTDQPWTVAAVVGASAVVLAVPEVLLEPWWSLRTLAHCGLLWGRHSLNGFTGGPVNWFLCQKALVEILVLEAGHHIDVLRADWYGLDRESAEKGGLGHVDTGSRGTFWSKIREAITGSKPAGMGTAGTPTVRDLVLIGGGHSHAYVLKNFGMNPLPGVKVTVISREVMSPYSGMLPGMVAGMYTKEEAHIDLMRLARFGNTRLIHAEACGIKDGYVILKGDRPPVRFDVLSINIGCTPQMSPSASNRVAPDDASVAAVTPVKPIDGFNARWDVIVERVVAAEGTTKLVIVGGGAGGIELSLNMRERFNRDLTAAGRHVTDVRIEVLTRGDRILASHAPAVSTTIAELLEERGVEVKYHHNVIKVDGNEIICSDGQAVPFDECIWCTQAGCQKWLKDTKLALDDTGFIKVNAHLQTSVGNIFAAGDCASLPSPRAKAGVFAVKSGPPLTRNLRRCLVGDPHLERYDPQETFLGVIGSGRPDVAVASKSRLAVKARWVWDLRDWIDRKWMAGYTHDLPEMANPVPEPPAVAVAAGTEALSALAHASMRCGGCGAKVGATVLSNVMKRLKSKTITRPEVLVGLDSPDDCAVVAPEPNFASVHTVDFFRSFIDDPYLFGMIAANHALSDCHAMCAEARTALAVAVVPYAVEAQVEETLYQMMAGACAVLAESNCALVGGHTCEGTELALGFCVNGVVDQEKALRKGGLRGGDAVILTKPIGTGTLFAAEMRMKAKGKWIVNALQTMSKSNRDGALCLRRYGARACTDVTGFGLLGHLQEMVQASPNTEIDLHLDTIPELEGARECTQSGIFSSLQPANLRLKRAIANESEALVHPGYPLLFDPQTAGGLLAAIPADAAADCVAELRRSGYPHATVIGQVREVSDGPNEIDGACSLPAGRIHCILD